MRLPFRLLAPAPLGLAVLLVLACPGESRRDLPAGWAIAGSRSAIEPTLERLELLSHTPLAAEAGSLRQAIAACDLFVAHCRPSATSEAPASCRLAEIAQCTDRLPDWAGDAPSGWSFVRRDRLADTWLLATATATADGSVAVEVEAGPVGLQGALALLAPAEQAAGPAKMSDADALIHVRIRPQGGLDLSRFVSGDGFADRMFRLRSELFEGRALAGVWELALYTPLEGELIPPIAMALDVRDRKLAVRGMEQFLAELQEVWPVRRSELEIGGVGGACLGNVRVMPDLAPCYVATPDALLVGWNLRSLELAMRAGEPASGTTERSGARAYFDRFPAADRIIAAGSGADYEPVAYPWKLLSIDGRRSGAAFRFHLQLDADSSR